MFRGLRPPDRASANGRRAEPTARNRMSPGNRSRLTPLSDSRPGLVERLPCGDIVGLWPVAFEEYPMAPRANWKGFLRLSLVTCPVALYPATSDTEKVSFNQINRKTGHRIKYAKVDADS